ncbi:MAG: MASE1 domain-containing protein [Elusimicrobia bacterium]|nr:MASE1 domain-containing protein [Elusimicrobiota bacterium]
MAEGARTRRLWRQLALTAAYFAAGKLGLRLAFLHSSATAVWPPSGIALAALLLEGYDLWPAVFAGALLVNLTTAGSPATSLCIAVGNTLEALAGCWLVRRFAGAQRAFDRPQDMFRFVLLAALLSTTLAATIGVASLFAAGYSLGAHFGPVWLTWWLGDAVGILLITPLIVLWSRGSRADEDLWPRLETAALGACLVLAGAVVFGGLSPSSYRHAPLEFMCFPILVWAAFRFGPRETAAASVLLAVMAVWGTLRGLGPFVLASPNESLLLLQSFLGVTCASILAFACACAQARRDMAGRLAGAQARYSRLIHASIVGIVEGHRDGRIVEANDRFLEMTGYTQNDLAAGRLRWDDMTPPEHRRRTASAVREMEETGEVKPYEKEFFRKDGSRVPVLVGGASIPGDPGLRIGFVLDITELKKASDIVRERAAELAQSNTDLSQFAYVASHDLQEPLHKIEAFGERLERRLAGHMDAEAGDYLHRMLKATARMERLIRDVLALARVTSRSRPLELVDLNAVAREVLGDLADAVAACGGRVALKELPVMMADPTQMRQLLQNLIGNALKFRKPGKPPVVRVSGRDMADGFAEIVVEDDGIGFDERYLNRIFQPFQRLHSARDYEGSGMGLAICDRIALRHGGRITARSAPGLGARFVVTLPCSQRPAGFGGRTTEAVNGTKD